LEPVVVEVEAYLMLVEDMVVVTAHLQLKVVVATITAQPLPTLKLKGLLNPDVCTL
jgi:hypothetical protein